MILKSPIDYNSRLVELIETKLELNSLVNFEQLSRLEELVYDSPDHKFMELLVRNRPLLEKRGIRVQAGGKLDPNASKRIDDPFLNEHLTQLSHSCAVNFDLCEEKRREFIEKLTSDYYGIEYKILEQNDNSPKLNNLFVAFEDALVLDTTTKVNTSSEEMRSRLFRGISECPLLTDLSEHLNWRVEYAASFGPSLKNYLASNPPESNSPPLNLLEIEPGRLLKLASNPEMEHLKSSIERGDATSACAQLVSLLALKYRTISASPQALIVNEMQSSLSVLLKNINQETRGKDPIERRLNYLNDVYTKSRSMDESMSSEMGARLNIAFMRFIAKFIDSIPFKMATKILFPFVLDPIVQMTSNHELKTQVSLSLYKI